MTWMCLGTGTWEVIPGRLHGAWYILVIRRLELLPTQYNLQPDMSAMSRMSPSSMTVE